MKKEYLNCNKENISDKILNFIESCEMDETLNIDTKSWTPYQIHKSLVELGYKYYRDQTNGWDYDISWFYKNGEKEISIELCAMTLELKLYIRK